MTEVKTITTEEVQERLENGETLFLVDVREDEEVAKRENSRSGTY